MAEKARDDLFPNRKARGRARATRNYGNANRGVRRVQQYRPIGSRRVRPNPTLDNGRWVEPQRGPKLLENQRVDFFM